MKEPGAQEPVAWWWPPSAQAAGPKRPRQGSIWIPVSAAHHCRVSWKRCKGAHRPRSANGRGRPAVEAEGCAASLGLDAGHGVLRPRLPRESWGGAGREKGVSPLQAQQTKSRDPSSADTAVRPDQGLAQGQRRIQGPHLPP